MPLRTEQPEEIPESAPAQEDAYYDPEIGETLMTWEFDEYEKGHRGRNWYIIMGLLATVLLVYAVLSENFTFALLILLFALVYFLLDRREPRRMTCIITDVGVGVGSRFHRYTDLGVFWIIYYPPTIKNLYLRAPDAQTPLLTIPLEDVNPVSVRETLLAFLDEDLAQEDIPIAESVGRILKL